METLSDLVVDVQTCGRQRRILTGAQKKNGLEMSATAGCVILLIHLVRYKWV